MFFEQARGIFDVIGPQEGLSVMQWGYVVGRLFAAGLISGGTLMLGRIIWNGFRNDQERSEFLENLAQGAVDYDRDHRDVDE